MGPLAIAGIGAGLGALGGGKGKKQSIGVDLDPQTLAYRNWAQGITQNMAGSPFFQQLPQLGLMGANALSGDPNAVRSLTEPLQPFYAEQAKRLLGQVGSQATVANAFGGSRQGVAEGVATGEVENQQLMEAMNRAGLLANLGLSGNQLLSQIIGQGYGPQGYTQTMSTPGNWMTGALGGALGAYGLFGGPKTAAQGQGLMNPLAQGQWGWNTGVGSTSGGPFPSMGPFDWQRYGDQFSPRPV